MEPNGIIQKSYTLTVWLDQALSAAAAANERSDSAELRVRLAASFGKNPDGTPKAVEQ